MSAPYRLEFRGVTKAFATKKGRGEPLVAVRDVSVALSDGEVVSIIGPSGCGKSTLLNMGAGLDRPTAGQVFVDGDLVTKPNSHVAFMLQKDLLLPWRNILENVELGQEIQGASKSDRVRRGTELLARYHLGDFAQHYPHQLSGGMRQRAALARTMAMNPDVVLLDEPFSALDAQTKLVLQKDLAQVLWEEKKTALFITHDISEAVSLSDRVLVMSRRPGTIIREMIIEIPDRPDPFKRRRHPRMGEYVTELLGLLGIVDGTLEDERKADA
ncbi:MAG: ABC transporter ATP-binding protein [Rhodospirillales bacterium]|nr:ABC transporter ATP-binding protein [Rhodospirillales bacterium]